MTFLEKALNLKIKDYVTYKYKNRAIKSEKTLLILKSIGILFK